MTMVATGYGNMLVVSTNNERVQTFMQQNQSASADISAETVADEPYRQTRVVYIDGLIVTNAKNRHQAVLEWGRDNRIRFYTLNPDNTPAVMLFDCQPQEIKKFSSGVGMANLTLGSTNKMYKIEFTSKTRNAALAGAPLPAAFGVAGFAVASELDKKAAEAEEQTDLKWWYTNLQQYGVRGMNTPYRMVYNVDKVGWWIIGIMLGVIALFMLVAAVIYTISALGIA